MSSILIDVKHKVGPSADYGYFERDLIDAINAAFAKLNQLGAGPEEGFRIEDENATWESFTTNTVLLGLVQTFVYDTARLIFDPPNSSYVINEINSRIEEYTFRILVEVDPKRED
jgi:hypothetical protein